MGLSNRFRWMVPTESNSIVDLLNFNKFKSSIKTYFQNLKWMNKNFVQVFYLPIIIDNTFHIIYGIRTPFIYLLFFSISSVLIMISAYRFTISLLFFFMFMDKFCLFLHLGFTYTTYITVKSEFIII